MKPIDNLVSQNGLTKNIFYETSREDGKTQSRFGIEFRLILHARELAGCFQNGNTIHAHTRELAPDALKRCVSLSHPTRVSVKRCKRTGKTTETVFENLISTPHAHYRLFVYSTRTIKINIFRERVGAQVFPHSDFPEGRGAMP